MTVLTSKKMVYRWQSRNILHTPKKQSISGLLTFQLQKTFSCISDNICVLLKESEIKEATVKTIQLADDEIAIIWSAEDVLSIREDLTPEQALEVLEQAENSHDAGIGINWDVLATHADWMFPEELTEEKDYGNGV
jgi:hypothetical protein